MSTLHQTLKYSLFNLYMHYIYIYILLAIRLIEVFLKKERRTEKLRGTCSSNSSSYNDVTTSIIIKSRLLPTRVLVDVLVVVLLLLIELLLY